MSMRAWSKNLLGVAVIALLTCGSVYAGVTGKIAGQIIEKSSGEPLPGANVYIDGAPYGASTDEDGTYIILNVPPGSYTLKVEMLGYARLTINDVVVVVDQTARLDFELESEAVAGDEVTVVAERKLVVKDVAASVASVTAEQVDALPITSVSEVLELQAGVEDGLVIRGGEANQALFMIDGFTLRDARNNQPVSGVALSSIQEVSLTRGGFSAEYGEVRSGLINVVTKDGGRDSYSGSVIVRRSNYSPKYFDESPFDQNSMWLRPYLDPDVAFVGTENGPWDRFTQSQYPLFSGWNAVSEALLANEDPADDLTPEQAQQLFLWQHRKEEVEAPDYNIDAGFGGPVPFIGKQLGDLRFFASYRQERELLLIPLTRDDYMQFDWNVKLTSDIADNMKLSLSTLGGRSYNVAVNGTDQARLPGTNATGSLGLVNSVDYMRSPAQIAAQNSLTPLFSSSRVFSNSYYSEARVDHRGLALNFTHVINAKTFYDASIDFFSRQYETGPVALRSAAQTQVAPGVTADEAPFGWSPVPETGIGDGILFGGHTSTARDSTETSTLRARVNLTNQFNFHHQFKLGFEIVRSNLDLSYGVVNLTFPESNAWVDETYNPLRFSAYVRDKMEFSGIIAEVGLRLDYSNSNTEWPDVDPFNQSFFSAAFDESVQFDTRSSNSKLSFSPRVGISHPVTENSKLFFNYGHFKQLPTYEELFQLSRGSGNQARFFGDAALEVAKTISYELGYDQSLFDDAILLQVAGFYHDITDQVATTLFRSANGAVQYTGLNNNSYEDIRGFELTLRKGQGRWFNGFGTYTYQVSTAGRFGRDEIFEDPSQQADFDNNSGNFAQDRPIPQPRANLVLSFLTPKDFGPGGVGFNPLGGWMVSMLADWQEGWWATRNPNQVPDLAQNVQVPDFSNVSLRLSKDFSFGNMTTTFLVDANNLFNRRALSLVGFYDNQDVEDYWNSLHLPESEAYDNIVGDDRYGSYRDLDVAYQPIIQIASIEGLTDPETLPFYYETDSGQYMQFNEGEWRQVDDATLQRVLDDKAYIDMPNQTSFNFLNPRDVYFGIKTSFNF